MAYPPGDLRNVFNVFLDFSAKLIEEDRRREHIRDLRRKAERRCGSCVYWMCKGDCPLEKGTMVGGPHCNHFPCGKFSGKSDQVKAVADLAAALKS